METTITITLSEFIYWLLPWLVLGFFILRIHPQCKTIDARFFDAIALVGILIFFRITNKFLVAYGYDEELTQVSIVFAWLGFPAFLIYMGIKERRYGLALLREKSSPIYGFEDRPDNVERDIEEARVYAKDRLTVSTVSLVLSLLWLAVGSMFYFA
jgi:hypothetical protein